MLRRAGLRRTEAERLATILVDAEAAGVATHGLVLLPRIIGALRSGELNAHARARILSTRAAVERLDGDNGVGQLIAWTAMEHAVRRARRHGIGLVAVCNTNHFGAASTYVEQAANAGCWGLAASNGSARVAPVGAREPLLSTSPLALAALGAHGERIVVDFSTAAIARGKVRQAAREGAAIPPGVAQDRDGQPTTDAARAMEGLLLPMGGERGLALGLLVELFAVLGGASLSIDVPRADDIWGGFGLGQTFVAIEPAALGAPRPLADQVSRLLHATRTLAGRAPGDRRREASSRASTHGITLSPSVRRQLESVGVEARAPLVDHD